MVAVMNKKKNPFQKGAVACLYQEGGITGIMFCHKLLGL